ALSGALAIALVAIAVLVTLLVSGGAPRSDPRASQDAPLPSGTSATDASREITPTPTPPVPQTPIILSGESAASTAVSESTATIPPPAPRTTTAPPPTEVPPTSTTPPEPVSPTATPRALRSAIEVQELALTR